jgi:hypothetical protein
MEKEGPVASACLGQGRAGPTACGASQMQRRGQQAFGPEERKEKIFFSFFISNFSNAFSNKDLNRI